MGSAYKRYDQAKQSVKRFLPAALLRHGINKFHLIESVLANIRYGFPARGMKFVGVTGTNGKTTTVNLIGSVLEASGYRVGINSTAVLQVGDKRWDNDISLTTANPFQLQKLLRDMKRDNCDWVVMEVASHALVQHRTWGIKFDVAVMTNLTRDHLDYHGTMEEYAKAKAKLFKYSPAVIALNHDDKWFEYYNQFGSPHKITYGVSEESEVRIKKARMNLKGTQLSMQVNGDTLDVDFKLPGKFNAYNAAAAVAASYALGLDLKDIKAGIEKLEAMPGRVQAIDEGQDFTVIIDHAHTPDALENVFKAIRMLLKGRLITVIGADGDRDPGKREPIGELAAKHSEVVIVTDQEPYTEAPEPIRQAVMKGVKKVKHGVVSYEIADRREAIKKALGFAKKGDVVLIPGLGNQLTRGMAEGKIPWDDRAVSAELLRDLKISKKTKKKKS